MKKGFKHSKETKQKMREAHLKRHNKQEFKAGDRVTKTRRYSDTQYCKFGGSEADFPIGSTGMVKYVDSDQAIKVLFDGIETVMTLDKSELEHGAKQPSLIRFMAYGLGCNNTGFVRQDLKELKKDLENYSEEWGGTIIGYKLVPILKAETKTIITKHKQVD